MWKNIAHRLNNIFKAKAITALDAVENPIEMYELAVQESDQNIQNLTKAIAIALADQKNRERELNQAVLESESWRNKAKAALEQSQPDLAKSALERKVIAERKVEEYGALNTALKTKIDEQRTQLERYKVKHEELKAKKSIYTAKYQTAKAQKQMAESFGGVNSSALSNVSRLEEKINKLEAESEAIMELTSGQNELDTKLEILEVSSRVNDELERLQLEMGQKEEAKRQQKLKLIEQQLNEVPKKELGSGQAKPNAHSDFYAQKSKPQLPPSGKDAIDNFFK